MKKFKYICNFVIFWTTMFATVYLFCALDFLQQHAVPAIILFLYILLGITYIANNISYREFLYLSGNHWLNKHLKYKKLCQNLHF